MVNTAYAMAQPPAQGQQQASPIVSLMPLILIFLVFYVLLIRPQKKQIQKHQQMVNDLAKGDRIITGGGIHGKVTALKGKQLEVEIAPNTRVIVNKSAVSGVVTSETEAIDV